MNAKPQTEEEWDRFGLLALGTIQVVLLYFFYQYGSPWFVAKMVGEWVFGLSVLVAITLGIYSFF
jgi:hypothetical protein